MKLVDAAAAMHRWAAVEAGAFATIGAWVPSTGDAAVKIRMARQSRLHGERARAWRELAPTDYGLDAVAHDGGRQLLDGLAGASGDIDRLATAHSIARVLLAEYRLALVEASPVSDGPMLRALRRAAAEIDHDLRRVT
jgi:hypothetical protein